MRAAGLEARGIDPSPAACAAAAALGVEVANVGVDEAEVEPGSEDAVVLWHALEHLDDPGRRAGADPLLAAPRRGARGRGPEPGLVAGARSAATAGFIRTCPATAPTSPRRAITALLERSGYRVERIRHLLVEQNPARDVADAAQPAHRASATSPFGR